KLTPWQKTLVARHALRPYTLDFVSFLFEDFTEIHGDRKFGDDAAIVAGFARFKGQACAIVGHQKGRNTKEKIARNFGQPRPEGCAAILWKNASAAPDAAAAMKITAHDLKKLGIIDEIVSEPEGGAHSDPQAAAEILGPMLERALKDVQKLKGAALMEERYKKFR